LGKPAGDAATQILYEIGVMKAAFQAQGDCWQKIADQFEKTDKDSIES
jgi:hypothetical protein